MLQNRNLVIIGGTTGLGLSAAKEFIHRGARIVVVGRNSNNCDKAKLYLGKNASVMTGDAMDPETAKSAIEICMEQFGSFNGLYHVAGGSGRLMGDGPLHELSLDGWNQTMHLNLTSLMLSNQSAVRKFLELKKPGTILNMGSVLGYSPSPKYFTTHAYATAKSAIIGFSRSIASYYAKEDIRINVLAPALIETPMSERATKDIDIQNFIKTKQPLDGGRIGKPEDLNGAACYLLSDQSSFVTGQVLSIDGGWCLSEGQYI